MADIQHKEHPSLLILGMGTGTYAHQCQRHFPKLTITGVEIDPKITALARQYFALPDTITVTAYDGRAYLAADRRQYDLIMVDAYQDITIPFAMSTREFFSSVQQHLSPGGVMVLNMNMKGETPGNINHYLADTVASVFPTVYTADVPHATNRELFAGDSPAMVNFLRQALSQEKNPELRTQLEQVVRQLKPYHKGNRILTDDRAPVELLGMRTIDGLIHSEVGQYREILKKQGIQGILGE